MRKSPSCQIEINSGDAYPDLATAQAQALPTVAADLAQSMRRLLAEGWLINDHGRIIPNPERIQNQ
ncbi:MAG TPA: hypothetical protein VIN60_06355 [Anaerolineales bacterium]